MVSEICQAWRGVDKLITENMGKEDGTHLAALSRNLCDQLGGKRPQAMTRETVQPSGDANPDTQDNAS